MEGYFLGIFVLCAIMGVLGLLGHGDGRVRRACFSVILLYTLLSPLAGELGRFDGLDIFGEVPNFGELSGDLNGYGEEAFCLGIARGISREFSIKEEDVSVRAVGFELEKMSAKTLRVLLSGRGALADTKAIKSYVDSMERGECEIEVGL